MSTFLHDPATGLGLGLIIGCTLTLVVFFSLRRENRALQKKLAASQDWGRTWRHDCLNALDENDRLRADNARLNGHPATRSDFNTHWSSTIRDHAEPFRERLAAVAPIVSLQRDGGAS